MYPETTSYIAKIWTTRNSEVWKEGEQGKSFYLRARHEGLKKPEKTERFRIYDGDGNFMAYGWIGGDDYTGFEPLWDYCTGAWGATDIKYRNPKTGEWESL